MDLLQPPGEEQEGTSSGTSSQSTSLTSLYEDVPSNTQPSSIPSMVIVRLSSWWSLLVMWARTVSSSRRWLPLVNRMRRAYIVRARRFIADWDLFTGWIQREVAAKGWRWPSWRGIWPARVRWRSDFVHVQGGLAALQWWRRAKQRSRTEDTQAPLVQRVSRRGEGMAFALLGIVGMLIIAVVGAELLPARKGVVTPSMTVLAHVAPTPTPTPIFDPNQDAVLPTNRVVAFYAVPDAEPTGPAYTLNDDVLAHLRQQGAAYQRLDPQHPVRLGIDLVVSVPDDFPGPSGNYSHHVDAATIQSYIDFCKRYNLLLFLDLNFGQAPIMGEVNFFLPYLEKYTFVHMAVDPEWMFPRRDGISGVNLSNVRASDLNPIIRAVAEIPMRYHVPRKILIIHQYRPDGDGLQDPYDAGQAEIADKRHLLFDPRVDVVIHVDSVGGYAGDIADKQQQYHEWVQQDMQKYNNFLYGGFKLFYHIEAKTRLMTPSEVLKLKPPPMVVTYGN